MVVTGDKVSGESRLSKPKRFLSLAGVEWWARGLGTLNAGLEPRWDCFCSFVLFFGKIFAVILFSFSSDSPRVSGSMGEISAESSTLIMSNESDVSSVSFT